MEYNTNNMLWTGPIGNQTANAVGIALSLILIDIDQGNGFLNINVKNTGNLKMSSKLGDKLGVGLENIRQRLDLIYSGKANLKMSEINDFVLASIKIPMV